MYRFLNEKENYWGAMKTDHHVSTSTKNQTGSYLQKRRGNQQQPVKLLQRSRRSRLLNESKPPRETNQTEEQDSEESIVLVRTSIVPENYTRANDTKEAKRTDQDRERKSRNCNRESETNTN